MAIDFSQVKTITIPEGSVTKITDSNGNILWKAQTEGWHTVFEGSWSRTWNNNTRNDYTNICTLIATDKPTKLRITGSINNTFYNPIIDLTWIGESKETFEFPSLPLAINKETTQIDKGLPSTDSNINILECKCSRWRFSDKPYLYFYLNIIRNSNILQSIVYSGHYLDDSGYTVTLNITKVEQYY